MGSFILSEEELIISHGKDSLQENVFNALMQKFLNKELVSGQVLNRRQIAEEMNVSVAPVLEALVLLEQDGFVTTIPRKGTIVSVITEENIQGQLIVREALECEAALLFTGKRFKKAFEEFKEFAKELDKLPIHSMEHAKKEIVFHASLVRLAGVDRLFNTFLRINRVNFFYRLNSLVTNESELKDNQLHVNLLDGLLTEDPYKASEIIRSHVRSGKPIMRHFYEY